MNGTDVFSKNMNAYMDDNVRVIVNEGGARSSKTYSVNQLLWTIAVNSGKPLTISIVSETLPHLKKGAVKDMIDILESEGVYSDTMHNKSDGFFKFGKSKIEYFSVDQSDRVRGPSRDILFVNEANNVSHETFNQLLLRTSKKVFIDFNPVAEFWAHTDLQHRDDVCWIKSTFRDNQYIPENILKEILQRKNNPNYANWWRIYGEGELGIPEGLVFSYFQQSKLPEGSNLMGYGLDFGYTNDPSALVAIYKHRDNYYVDEIFYQTGLMGQDMIRLMKQMGVNKNKYIYADSADPRLIREIGLGGFNCKGVKKEKLYTSIEFTKKYFKFVTPGSTNLVKELRNYMYIMKNDKYTNEPMDAFNHAIDAMRYGFLGLFGRSKLQFI